MKSKQRLKKLVCLVLCVLLLMPSFVLAQSVPANTDIKGHWAEKQINDWLLKGYASTYQDGSFRPNTGITRAELASVVNKAFGFTEKDETNFKDVSAKDSFYNDMAIAKKAAYLKGNEKGNANPTAFMTRQEFAVIIQRLMKLENPGVFKAIDAFKDVNSIPAWSKGAIEAIVANGYMIGTPDKAFKPTRTVTRAEAITTLDRSFIHFIRVAYDKAGIYNAETVNGSVAINVPDVTLQNTVVNGDLIIGKGVGEGNVTLKNVTIKGNTIVKGGGMNSIIVENCTLANIIINKEGNMVRVVAVGSTSTGNVDMQSGGKLEDAATTGDGFGYVTIAEAVDDGTPIILVGNFGSIEVQGKGINLDLSNGSVKSLDIAPTAANTNLNVGTGATISNLILAAPTTLAGTGTVAAATVQGNNVTLDVTGTTTITQLDVAATASNSSINLGTGSQVTNMKVDSAASVTGTGSIGTAQVNASGSTITAPTTTLNTATGVTVVTTPPAAPPPVTPPSTGGGSGSNDNGNSNIAVSAITVTGTGNASTITVNKGTLQMLAAVTPTNATNKTVTWSVINGTGTASISDTGLLKAISNGIVTVRAAAKDGSGKYGTINITISNQIPTILFSSTQIANGAVNPDIVVNVDNDIFTASEISTMLSNWSTSLGTTGLTISSITRNSNTQVVFHMNGTAQAGMITLKAKAAALANEAESNAINVFVLTANSGAAGTIETAEAIDGIVDVEPSINGQSITFNGKVEYYLATQSNGLPKSANWVGVKITAPEGVSPDDTAVAYVNGRIINAGGALGWNNIRTEGDGDNYFYLYQRVTDLSRVYSIIIKWNNSLTEAYTINFAETAVLEALHGAIELAEGMNGGPRATAAINGQEVKFYGEIEYLRTGEGNGVPFPGNWVGVKITAPEGVVPDEYAVLTARGQVCNRDGKPGWENIREEGDGDNYFYLYQRVRQTGYVYEVEIKWNKDVTEIYNIVIAGSATLEVYKTDLANMIDGAKYNQSHGPEYGIISQEALDAFDAAIREAQTVYDEAVNAKTDAVQNGVYEAQNRLMEAIDAFFDSYETKIAALSGNMTFETTYADTEPLIVTLELMDGIGDFASDLENYLTLNGALFGMTIKSITYKGDPSNIAILELAGTTGSNMEEAVVTIAEGGVNGHHHGFEASVASVGTIELAERINGGANATVTINGHEIRFFGEIEYLIADASNGLPISGNWVGVKITAPAGVYPDENAVLTVHGRVYNIDGKPGWGNIREEGDGDNYFYLYQRVRMTGYVYVVEIKWNNDVTEEYLIVIPRSTTLQYSEAEFIKLENMLGAARGYHNGAENLGVVSAEAIAELGSAISDAEAVASNAAMTQIYAAQIELAAAMDKVLNEYKFALTEIINAEFSDGEARTAYALEVSDYTAESWLVYTDAISAAISIEGDQGATQEAIEAAIIAINIAKENLVRLV